MATLFHFDLAGQSYDLAISGRRFYVLEGGRLLPVRVWPAWCEQCRTFTEAEQIFPAADEAKELSEVEHFANCPGHIPPDRRVFVWQLPELRLRKEWRGTRRSPAKCLDCGSVNITSIWPGPDVDIPGRGKCVGRFGGWADMSGPPARYYGAEGDRMAVTPDRLPSAAPK